MTNQAEIQTVCDECGIEANRQTCLKKYGKEPKKSKFDFSTYHQGVCDWCRQERAVTQAREFFNPDFSLMETKKEVTP